MGKTFMVKDDHVSLKFLKIDEVHDS